MPDIHLRRLCKQFAASRHAVRDVDLTVQSGELLTLVGPSGSGKSTLLRLLAGLLRPTSGRIWFGDRDVTDLSPARRDVSMVFQGDNHFPHLTVSENLVIGLRLRRHPIEIVEQRRRETVATMGLQDLLDRWPEGLSGGESQRVALGRVLANQSTIDLLDEPLVHVDPSQRRSLHTAIRDLHQHSGSTMIHVTHDQLEAMSLGQRMAVMHGGRILQVDIPERVYAAPVNSFVAQFVGDPPMNLFSARIDQRRLSGLAPGADVDAGDGPVVVGIRPEHLSLRGECEYRLSGHVRSIEFVGSERILEVELPEGACTVRTTTSNVSVGCPVELHFDRKDLHFFAADAEGQRIDSN